MCETMIDDDVPETSRIATTCSQTDKRSASSVVSFSWEERLGLALCQLAARLGRLKFRPVIRTQTRPYLLAYLLTPPGAPE